MADVKWIKIVTDVFDDEKILLIETLPDADSIIVIWFKLLCLAGKQNNGGVFLMGGRIPYTEEMFATIFRRPLNTVRLALHTFHEYGMVDIIDSTVTIPHWEKHQSLDAYEQSKEKTRLRVAAHRERQKALIESNVTCNVTDDVTVTDCNAVDKIRKEENRGDKQRGDIVVEDINVPIKPNKRFTPPTVEEVKVYCQERQNEVDAQRFVDYYTSNGWMVGKNKMKDWKAAVRTWEKKDKPHGRSAAQKSSNPFLDMMMEGGYE